MEPALSLFVLRSPQPDNVRSFYAALGMTFVREQHGSGPEHWSATLEGGLVIEVYPAGPETAVELSRLGFAVAEIKEAVASAVAHGGSVVSQSRLRAVVADPDGRRVELTAHPD